MVRRKPLLVLAFAVALSALGCGEDCEGLCEARKDCAGANEDEDCATACDRLEALNERADCDEQYDEYASCSGELDDICHDDGGECRAEAAAYADCVTKYCRTSDADCD